MRTKHLNMRQYEGYWIEWFKINGGWGFEAYNDSENSVGDNESVPYPTSGLAISAACHMIDEDIDRNS